MNKMRALILIFSAFVITSTAVSQEKPLEGGTIENQIDFMVEKSNRWENFRVVRLNWLEKLKQNVTDSIGALKIKLVKTENVILTHKNEIEALKLELQEVNNNLATLKFEKDNIDIVGLQIEKSTYKNIMWSISAGLLIFLMVFIFRFKRSNSITAQISQTLSEIQEEFNIYRKRSMEKEQKLARELQSEINKRL